MNRFILTGAPLVLALLGSFHLHADQYVKIGNRQVILPSDNALEPPIKAQWKVLGWGTNREEATQDALNKALDVVVSYLDHQTPNSTWEPDSEWIRRYLTDLDSDPAEPLPKENMKISAGDHDITALCYTVTVTITDQRMRHIRHVQERFARDQVRAEMRERSLPRVLLTGKIVAGFVVGLLLIVGASQLKNRFIRNRK